MRVVVVSIVTGRETEGVAEFVGEVCVIGVSELRRDSGYGCAGFGAKQLCRLLESTSSDQGEGWELEVTLGQSLHCSHRHAESVGNVIRRG